MSPAGTNVPSCGRSRDLVLRHPAALVEVGVRGPGRDVLDPVEDERVHHVDVPRRQHDVAAVEPALVGGGLAQDLLEVQRDQPARGVRRLGVVEALRLEGLVEQLHELVVGERGVVDVLDVLDQVRALTRQALVDQGLEELAQRRACRRRDHDRVPARRSSRSRPSPACRTCPRSRAARRRASMEASVVNWFVTLGSVGSWNCWSTTSRSVPSMACSKPVDVALAEVVVEGDRRRPSWRRGARLQPLGPQAGLGEVVDLHAGGPRVVLDVTPVRRAGGVEQLRHALVVDLVPHGEVVGRAEHGDEAGVLAGPERLVDVRLGLVRRVAVVLHVEDELRPSMPPFSSLT